jgi:hypothetical protein
MSAPTYLVERDAWENRRNQQIDHDHREVECDDRHFMFWALPRVEPLSREFIAERVAHMTARLVTGQNY